MTGQRRTLENGLSIREARSEDLEIVLRHRMSMFLDMGYRDREVLEKVEKESRKFFSEHLDNGRYRGWFVENANHEVVAGGGVVIHDYHPQGVDPTLRRPVIVNMYTEPSYRRQGLARELMNIMVEWCRKEGFGTVLLHASNDGRPLYESLGFKPTNEMRLMLR
ncbi:MAG TPA: GNAT family N-acetyltransferase [Bacteroidota bacterium]|nr:GNAT family N-acetyltransferase [Bacteroidota bacterium]